MAKDDEDRRVVCRNFSFNFSNFLAANMQVQVLDHHGRTNFNSIRGA